MNWSPVTKASALDEALFPFSTGPALFLLAATAATLVFRSQLGGLTAVEPRAGMVMPVTTKDEITEMARTEGCIGSPSLFIGLVAAISVGTVLYTMPHQRGD